MKKLFIKNLQNEVLQVAVFDNDKDLENFKEVLKQGSWGKPEREETDEMGKPTGKTLPAEYLIEVVDITEEVKAKKDKEDKKIKDRKDRVIALQALDWSKITTIAHLKAVVKLLAEETLKDEE